MTDANAGPADQAETRIEDPTLPPPKGINRRYRLGLHGYMVATVLVAVVPLLAFVFVVFSELRRDEYAAVERVATRDATAIAYVVGQQLRDMETALRVLASGPELEAGEFQEFHDRARRALTPRGWFALLVRSDGQMILNTRVAFGHPLGSTSNIAALQTALEQRQVHVSDVFFGKTSGKWVFNVILPLPEDLPGGASALILTQNADEFAGPLAERDRPTGWHIALLDGQDCVVATTSGLDAGAPFPAASAASSGGGRLMPFDRSVTVAGDQRVEGTGWRAIVWGPLATARLRILSTTEFVFTIGGATVLLATVLALALTRRLQRATRWLSEGAEALGRGEPVPDRATGVRDFDLVMSVLHDASLRQQQDRERQALLVGELSHRIKNLLAMVHGMVHQTGRHSSDVEAFRSRLSGRLDAMARSVDLLIRSDWKSATIQDLLQQHVMFLPETERRVSIAGTDLEVSPEAANALGMIFHELATNAQKYGALAHPNGRIDIVIEMPADGPGELRVEWIERDAAPTEMPASTGYGTRLIRSLCRGLGGSSTVEYGSTGLKWVILVQVDRIAVRRDPQAAG